MLESLQSLGAFQAEHFLTIFNCTGKADRISTKTKAIKSFIKFCKPSIAHSQDICDIQVL